MNTANIFKNGTFWNFWMQCAEPLVSASSTHQDLWPHKGIMAIWCQVLLFYGLSLLPWNPENLSMCHSNQWKALESHQLNTNPGWYCTIVEKMCQIQKNIQKKNITIDHYSFQISTPIKFLRKFLLNITYLDCSTTFLTSDDFIRSNEIVRTKWTIH